MGGLYILPEISLQEINAEEVDLLFLPGGNAWEEGDKTRGDHVRFLRGYEWGFPLPLVTNEGECELNRIIEIDVI